MRRVIPKRVYMEEEEKDGGAVVYIKKEKKKKERAEHKSLQELYARLKEKQR